MAVLVTGVPPSRIFFCILTQRGRDFKWFGENGAEVFVLSVNFYRDVEKIDGVWYNGIEKIFQKGGCNMHTFCTKRRKTSTVRPPMKISLSGV